jgi:hypothetical protein
MHHHILLDTKCHYITPGPCEVLSSIIVRRRLRSLDCHISVFFSSKAFLLFIDRRMISIT